MKCAISLTIDLFVLISHNPQCSEFRCILLFLA